MSKFKEYMLDKGPNYLSALLSFAAIGASIAIAIGLPQAKFNISPHIKVSIVDIKYCLPWNISLTYCLKEHEVAPHPFMSVYYYVKILVLNDGNRASFINDFRVRMDGLNSQEIDTFYSRDRFLQSHSPKSSFLKSSLSHFKLGFRADHPSVRHELA